MKKKIALAFFALMIVGMISVSASAVDHTHSVWTTNSGGRKLVDPDLGCVFGSGNFHKFRTITSWTEISPGYDAQAHFRGIALIKEDEDCAAGELYEITLNQSSATTASTITGTWDIRRNGTLVCSACTGQAINLNLAVTNFYNVLIDDPVYGAAAWDFSGFIDVRMDY